MVDGDGELDGGGGAGDAIVVEDFCDGRVQGLEADALMAGVVLQVGELGLLPEVGVDREAVAVGLENAEYEYLGGIGHRGCLAHMPEQPTGECDGIVADIDNDE